MTENTAPARPTFRFGVFAPVLGDIPTWQDQARKIADLGFSTLLMPDIRMQPAPSPTLAMAATVTNLRVGPWVSAAPLRPAWSLAWEAHSMSVLTGGRYELGLGAGRPGIEEELRGLGMPDLVPGERFSRMRDTVAQLRELDGDLHTPVVLAVRRPKAVALAIEIADTITFAEMPGDTRATVMETARSVRAARADVELALHVAVVGDRVSPFMSPPDTDTAALRAENALKYLPADPAAATEELLRRGEEGGSTYVVIGADTVDTLAPVVAELAGR